MIRDEDIEILRSAIGGLRDDPARSRIARARVDDVIARRVDLAALDPLDLRRRELERHAIALVWEWRRPLL